MRFVLLAALIALVQALGSGCVTLYGQSALAPKVRALGRVERAWVVPLEVGETDIYALAAPRPASRWGPANRIGETYFISVGEVVARYRLPAPRAPGHEHVGLNREDGLPVAEVLPAAGFTPPPGAEELPERDRDRDLPRSFAPWGTLQFGERWVDLGDRLDPPPVAERLAQGLSLLVTVPLDVTIFAPVNLCLAVVMATH